MQKLETGTLFQLEVKVTARVQLGYLKFILSKKATKIDKIIIVDLTLCSKCQIEGEDFVNFSGLLRKSQL